MLQAHTKRVTKKSTENRVGIGVFSRSIIFFLVRCSLEFRRRLAIVAHLGASSTRLGTTRRENPEDLIEVCSGRGFRRTRCDFFLKKRMNMGMCTMIMSNV